MSQQPLDAVSMRKGIASLLAQLNADHPGYRWRVASPPEGLEGSAVMGAGEVDLPRVGAPHDEHAIGNGLAALKAREHRLEAGSLGVSARVGHIAEVAA